MGGSGGSPVGDRAVSGSVLNSTVITGDGNVVLHLGGKPYAEVSAPRSAVEAERLLVAVESRLGVGVPSQWLRPEAGIVAVEPRREVEVLAGWCGRWDRGPAGTAAVRGRRAG